MVISRNPSPTTSTQLSWISLRHNFLMPLLTKSTRSGNVQFALIHFQTLSLCLVVNRLCAGLVLIQRQQFVGSAGSPVLWLNHHDWSTTFFPESPWFVLPALQLSTGRIFPLMLPTFVLFLVLLDVMQSTLQEPLLLLMTWFVRKSPPHAQLPMLDALSASREVILIQSKNSNNMKLVVAFLHREFSSSGSKKWQP